VAAELAAADAPCTTASLLQHASARLRDAGVEAARLEARRMLAHVLGCRTEALLAGSCRPISPDAVARFDDMLHRRIDRTPLSHLLGAWGFWSFEVGVSPATLTPRPDSETLIEAALQAFPERDQVRRVLDLGTGTGCLLGATLLEFPRAVGFGVDRSLAAAALASGNAGRLGLRRRAFFLVGDWAASLRAEASFDLVMSNPPYIPTATIGDLMPEVSRHEPQVALDGGQDGLNAYRGLLPRLPALLRPDSGRAILELGQGQRMAVETLARSVGLLVVTCLNDLAGIERALVLRA
jgi:release factor glutamine methyltransferase